MSYEKNHYYQFKKDASVIRFTSKENDWYEFISLQNNEPKKIYYKEKDLICVEVDESITHCKSTPFMHLSITVCRILELNSEPTQGLKIFKKFINGLVDNNKSLLELNIKDFNYLLEDLNIKGGIGIEVKDNINDFFSKIDKAIDRQLTILEKDNFIKEQFNNRGVVS